jgi:hypothetical protein
LNLTKKIRNSNVYWDILILLLESDQSWLSFRTHYRRSGLQELESRIVLCFTYLPDEAHKLYKRWIRHSIAFDVAGSS